MKYYVVVVAFSLCSTVEFCKQVWVTRTSTTAHQGKELISSQDQKSENYKSKHTVMLELNGISTGLTILSHTPYLYPWTVYYSNDCNHKPSLTYASIELFHQPTLMHNFLYSLTICLLHYYPRHVSSINMPIFRSVPVYCADVYRERRYQMQCEYNFFSWRWAC